MNGRWFVHNQRSLFLGAIYNLYRNISSSPMKIAASLESYLIWFSLYWDNLETTASFFFLLLLWSMQVGFGELFTNLFVRNLRDLDQWICLIYSRVSWFHSFLFYWNLESLGTFLLGMSWEFYSITISRHRCIVPFFHVTSHGHSLYNLSSLGSSTFTFDWV